MAIKASSTITLIRVDDGDNGIIIQASAPVNPYVGQLWQTASGAPVKRWDGSKWVIWYLDVKNLNVDDLSAISSTLGTVSNPYDAFFEGERLKGETTISDAIINSEYTVVETGQKGYWEIHPFGYSTHLDDGNGKTLAGISLSISSLMLYDNRYNQWLSLSKEMLYDTGWVKQAVLVGTGNIYARRWMGRKMIRFDNYVYDGSGQYIATLTGDFKPDYGGMYFVPVWAINMAQDKMQFGVSGNILKLTNNSGSFPITAFLEYY